MNPRLIHCVAAALLAAAGGFAQANTPLGGQSVRAMEQYARLLNGTPAHKTILLANKPVSGRGMPSSLAVSGVAPGQAGYVHYFLIKLPDDTVEIQVGIELADQRIAWSFPGMGVVVSPFIAGETIEAGSASYDVWHLYGLRPMSDAGAMARLQRELPGRIARWVNAGVPYCLDDAPKQNCMSCLGFVMRVLFPGRDDYPAPPRSFSRTTNPSRYTPNDLLLYLTGMHDLPDRNTRLQRINTLALPPDLRLDLEKLVYAMGAGEAAPREALQKRTDTPQTPRRRL